MAKAIETYAQDLSRPAGLSDPIAVIQETTRHKLWIQSCFWILGGVGKDESLTLKDEDHFLRIDDFIELLSECKESVQFLQLTLNQMLNMLILPAEEHDILLKAMLQKLNVSGPDHPFAEYLE